MTRLITVLLACLVAHSEAFGVPARPAVLRQPHQRSPVSALRLQLDLPTLLTADGPQMADGAYAVAIAGGVFTILLAGIPILFLNKDKPDDAATKMANLEKGLAETEEVELTDEEVAKLMDEP